MCYAIFSHFILTAHALQVTPLHFLPNNQGAPDEEEPSPQPPEFPQTPPLTEVPQPNDPPDYPEAYSFHFTFKHYWIRLLAFLSPTARGAVPC